MYTQYFVSFGVTVTTLPYEHQPSKNAAQYTYCSCGPTVDALHEFFTQTIEASQQILASDSLSVLGGEGVFGIWWN